MILEIIAKRGKRRLRTLKKSLYKLETGIKLISMLYILSFPEKNYERLRLKELISIKLQLEIALKCSLGLLLLKFL